MPYIQFDLPRDSSEDDFDAVAKRVADLYAGVMQTTPSGVTVAVRELGARRVLRDGRPSRSVAISVAAVRTRNARPSQSR